MRLVACLYLLALLSSCASGRSFKPMDSCYVPAVGTGVRCVPAVGDAYNLPSDQAACFPIDQFKPHEEACHAP